MTERHPDYWHCINDVTEARDADDWCFDGFPSHDTVEIGPDSAGGYSVVHVGRDDDGNVMSETTVGRGCDREMAMGVAEGFVQCLLATQRSCVNCDEPIEECGEGNPVHVSDGSHATAPDYQHLIHCERPTP